MKHQANRNPIAEGQQRECVDPPDKIRHAKRRAGQSLVCLLKRLIKGPGYQFQVIVAIAESSIG